MGFDQPYMYDSDLRDSRSPGKEFDPKAVTRASWEPKPKKPKQDGPLVNFNRHPDAHQVPTSRTYNFRPMSNTTKSWIKGMRYFQIFLRALELVGGIGLLVLMVLISNVDMLTSWVMRITPAVAALCSTYAIFHLARPARARPPASSAAYQLFAGFTDLAILPLYAFGAISVINHGAEWSIVLADKDLAEILIRAEYYGLFSAGACHVFSLVVSVWLGLQFRRIANMPPDMNPLEGNLTSRVKHQRNKSSVASGFTTMSSSTKHLSDSMESRRQSGVPNDDLSRPPSIPFMATRSGSPRSSYASSKNDSGVDLPSRQYQVTPGNSPRNSPRTSGASLADLKRLSNPRLSQRGSYTEIPLHETGSSISLSSSRLSGVETMQQPMNGSPSRITKFTEAWYASESLIQRTQQRQRAQNAMERAQDKGRPGAYEALNQRYELDSDSDGENGMAPDMDSDDDGGICSSPINASGSLHPNPLRSNPLPPTPPRQKTPFHPRDSALAEISLNSRSVSGSQDIADEKPARHGSALLAGWKRGSGNTARTGARNSSIQPESDFYSKPYGSLKPATPPIMVGSGRQVSSGNDYDLGSMGMGTGNGTGYRRNVSGRAAEEGMAGPETKRYSRYSVLNLD
ncbi:hypothetical protein F5Y15DRAFT_366988 [Xylariaceae sp. FL0016]|nr:hypothetical protein F5Y15DRAFT_366988 [Xylariaceae sp. FL0016]